jgi:hypothetical protein
MGDWTRYDIVRLLTLLERIPAALGTARGYRLWAGRHHFPPASRGQPP